MKTFMPWMLLTMLTGSPLVSAAVVLAAWYFVDRSTVGVFGRVVRAVRRLTRMRTLRRLLAINPHDRRARLELGELLLEHHRPAAALGILRPAVEAGDQVPELLFALGRACLQTGHATQGEQLLEEVEAESSGFRLGAVELERGRYRLERRDAAGAVEALERFCRIRHGTVEGKVLLARALAALGREAEAADWRAKAWEDYVHAPGFRQRAERLWAWRVKPWRPVAWAGLGLVVLFTLARLATTLGPAGL
jgi:predicted Zn-dependent protease